jgi:peptidoglycan-N-acetylglucosamine deacetylase
MRRPLGSGFRWLLATAAFVVTLSIALAATKSKSVHPPSRPAAAAQPDPSFTCPKPRKGVWVGARTHGRRLVALSFDDGPSPATPAILRALRRHQAHATFFAVGDQIRGRRAILRRAVEQGDEIGNHSTTHTPLPGHSDIAQASNLIERATGRPPCLFRPPDGDTSPALLRDVNRLGMTTIAWDIDSGDWQDQSPADIEARALAGVHPGAIILLHDGGGARQGTVESVSRIVSTLQASGYRVVTVSKLFHPRH